MHTGFPFVGSGIALLVAPYQRQETLSTLATCLAMSVEIALLVSGIRLFFAHRRSARAADFR
jgi:hypothetical protein